MVCGRCISAVQAAMRSAGLDPLRVSLGEVVLRDEELSDEQLSRIDDLLAQSGFERIGDRKARLIEAIKNKVIQLIHHREQVELKTNWSDFLSDELHYEYNYLSSLFSSVEGITLEHYIIRQKIERAKELLVYDELNVGEIASRLGYSSAAHLSAQFKKVTGFTPSSMKRLRQQRKPIDQVV